MGHPYPGNWNFKHHPWLEEMHNSKAPLNIGMKGAQVGFTECVLNIAFYFIDVRRMDVLYVLPNLQPDAKDFSSGRFDKALELSRHLKEMFSDVKNIGHKRAGTANLYIRGSRVESALKAIPVSLLVLDELEEMEQKNIPLAAKRLSGQLERYEWMISTPRIHDSGIHFYYEISSKGIWKFPCPSCSRWIDLGFNNLKVIGESETDPRVSESHLICVECKAKLNHEDKIIFLNKGAWHHEFPDREEKGWHVNQLYAMHLKPAEQAKEYLLGLKDEVHEQEFHNSTLGRPHIVKGARLEEADIEKCFHSYRMLDFNRQGLVTMGIDVGRVLNIHIDQWYHTEMVGQDGNTYSKPRNIYHGEIGTFEELDMYMVNFGVKFAVIDSDPDGRKALEFASKWHGQVKLCRFTNGAIGRNLYEANENQYTIHVDRTSWLDIALGRYRRGDIQLPGNTGQEYKRQVTAPVRVVRKNKAGNPVAVYETPGNRADHYAFARCYAEIALPLALGLGTVKTFSG
jgi:hypothetical protein